MSISQRDRKLMALVIAEMERLEGQQLNFGINNTRITVDFLTRSLSSDFTSRSLSSDLTPPTAAEVQAALDYQMKQGEIIEVEQGVYRSRIAETARCIRLVRQRFFDRSNQPRRIVDSMELVEAIRTEFRQRTRPNRRQVSIEELLDTGGVELDSKLKDSLRWAIEEGLGWKGAAAFQSRAFRSIYALSQRSNAADEAIVVAGDTGSGKTEAFLFPILARIAQEKKNLEDSHIHSGVGAVLVYPRIRLALNQLERIARILKLWELYGGPRLTIGIQNAQVPTLSNDQYNKSWNSARERYGAKIPDRAVVMDLMPCPFEPSPDVLAQLAQENLIEEGSQLVFEDIGEVQAANSDFPRLVSKEPRYWKPQSEGERTAHQEKLNNGVFDQLLVTKSALKRGRDDLRLIPDILIITNKSLSQYLLQPEFQHLWGLWSNEGGHKVAPPRFLVLDEIHLLSGLEGAHLSRLISRFQARVSLAAKELGMGTRYALPIGVSATLYDEAGFMAKILGIDPDEASSKITVRKPEDTDSIEKELADTEGRERYIFVRPHEIPNPEEPERRVGSMAAAIQIVMASMHNLMSRAEGRNLQYKGLAFFDSVNDVNLFEQFYNSRGSNSDLIQQGANTMRLWSIRTMHTCPLTKTSCKFSNLRGGEQVFYNSCPIFLAGDCWVFAEKWGWDDLLKVSRANYSGVYTDIQKSQLIPTTPVLEVGYDDDAIQFVYQHMAPNNVASFIQRRGRAGRNPEQSPVIVTLLWPYRSRDLFYFYRPNYLYEPSFDDIPLNSRNRHVQLTHAFLAIFDWLAIRQATVGWIGAPGEELSILSANYTTIGGESGSIPKSSGGYYKRRWELRQQRLTGWGSTILIRAEQEIQRYLQMQQPELAPDIVREAIGLLRDSFFQPQNHRIPGASEPVEHNNFLSTFKLIDFNLQGDSGDSVVEATYPKPRAWSDNEVYLTAEERRKEPSMPLERGITELLPGNVTYRLRIRNESHWTPIPPDGASTYLYPDQQAGASSLRDNKGREYSLKRLRDSLMGIPSSLEALYEGLYYFKPRSLAAQVFRYHEEDPRWVYDAVNKMALPASSADPRRNRNLRHLDTHSQAFASSIVVPFRPAHAQPSQKIRPPKQLDQIFALINAYLNEDIGYLQLFYEYTISPRLKKSGPGDQLDTRPKLRRLFYGSDSSPERRVPRMAAYEIHTQGLEFIVSEEFCRKVVLRALSSEELRLHYRQRYVAYRLAKNAQFIDQTVLPSSYIELGRMIVAYWLAHHVPANRGDTGKWILSEIDLPAIQAFVEGSESFLAQWCGGQQWSTLFRNIERRDGGVGRFFDEVNRALQEGFTESRPFREYLESVVLHSLAAVVKNHCALLGGVSPESLVVYVDLPGMERVSQPEQPRILVLDSVSGGSGAIGQAFENLTRRPQRTSAAKNSEERNLWALLQTGLGTCPVGDGEMLLRRFLLSMEYREAIAFIEAVRSADDLEGPAQLRAAVEKAGLPIPDEATFETVARTIFAGEVYIASNARRNGSPDAAEELRMSIQPPLIVHELLRQEDRLEKQLGYRPQPEIVVARVLSTMNSGTWPCIERMQQAIRSDLATNRAVAEREKPGRLRAQMTTQLLGLLPRHCEDGCPVCLVSGSNTEISQLAPYMNSRRLLRQVHEILLVDSVQRSDQPVRDLMESKSVRLSGERRLPGDLDTSAGTLKANTFFDTRQKPDTTLIPAVSIDAHGNNRYLSLLKGNPINSREEAVIANYLDVRSKRDGWLYEYNPLRTFRDPQTREDVHLRPNFFVQVPYTVNGEEGMQEMIVEFIAREDLEGYRAVMEIKMRCYRRARKPCIPIKPEDLNEYTFVHKLEEFVREEILKQEQEAFVSFSSLSDLLPIAD